MHDEIKVRTRHLKQITAAAMWVTAGDDTDRVRSEAMFAKLGDVCALPAGSGKPNGRHRLNRGGGHQADAALTVRSSSGFDGTHRSSRTSSDESKKDCPSAR